LLKGAKRFFEDPGNAIVDVAAQMWFPPQKKIFASHLRPIPFAQNGTMKWNG